MRTFFTGDIQYIEADIVLGTIINDTSNKLQPIMAHPPDNTSDISLDTFLTRILDFNKNETQKKKGVKLDFKSIDVFNGSLELLKTLWESVCYLKFEKMSIF